MAALACVQLEQNLETVILSSRYDETVKRIQKAMVISMTETSRLETLKQMVEQEPDDEFSRYGLALEYKKIGEVEESLKHFTILIERKPDYVPGYFMSGQLLAEEGRIDEAKARLKEGIRAAERSNDQHAVMEMTEVLDTL